jgi:exosortase
MSSILRRCNGWTVWRLALAVLLCAAGAVATLDAWADMLRLALRDEEASHALLVPPIAAWLVWVRRGRLRHCVVGGTWVGPLLVVVGWAMYSVGQAQLWDSVWHAGAITVAIGCFLSAVGKNILREMLPAFVALYFMVPVPGRVRQQIAVPLQTVTAQATQQLFELFGVLIDRSGNVLNINGVDVAITEACNGLRMVFALTLVSYAFAFATPLRGYVRAIVLAASPVSAVACNVARLVPTVWMYGNHPAAIGDRFHNLSGWAMLIVAFLVLVGMIRFLRWAMVPVTRFTLAHDG